MAEATAITSVCSAACPAAAAGDDDARSMTALSLALASSISPLSHALRLSLSTAGVTAVEDGIADDDDDEDAGLGVVL